MNFDNTTYRLTGKSNFGNIGLIVGIIFLGLSAVSYFVDGAQHFYLTYLTGFFFWLTIALGALIFIMIHHITSATWSTVLRRVSENIAATMPLFLILFIPIALGLHTIFEWSHPGITDPASEHYDAIIAGKSGYLNSTFFYIRAAGYFVIWILLSGLLRKSSLAQDKEHTADTTKRFKKITAPGILLFAMSTTFASFDWLMSLDPHWFSTIFGVYIFAGGLLAFLCFMIVLLAYYQRKKILTGVVTVEHFQDISKLLFGFLIFWAYMAFSQYFLIWYADLPEETYWFLYRWENSWKTVSLLILFGHFIFPFIALITRAAKRSIGWMVFMSSWLLLMHFVDLYWLILPSHYRDGWHFSVFDFAPVIGIGGLFLYYFWRNQSKHPLVPVNDPTLEVSKKFLNS